MDRDQHFILTLGRSGSNTLVDALNQNPAILNFGEVLGDWMSIRKLQKRLRLFADDDAAYLDALLGNRGIQRAANFYRSIGKMRRGASEEIKRFRGIQSFGVKEFSLNMAHSGLLDYLGERPSIKVIGLIRRNPIDRMMSSFRLDKTGTVSQAQTTQPGGEKGTSGDELFFEPSTVLDNLELIQAENDDLLRVINGLPTDRVLQIDYNDFYSGEERSRDVLRAAQDFLGVPVMTPTIRMTKIIKSDPLEILSNSMEVRREISNSKFAKFLYSG